MDINKLTEKILGFAFQVHSVLGPGLLESAYEECLFYELTKEGFSVSKQKEIPLVYKEIKLERGYRADLVADNKVVIEIKSIDAINDIHVAQMLTYLRLTKCQIGLLINFNVKSLKDVIRRFIL
ncbi:MAG: GxxExxY protein [Bacteroidetes bacterium]|nr:MAG: GxxExxY protein [Bacteroidota bacterium]